jgi:hypothetical protein
MDRRFAMLALIICFQFTIGCVGHKMAPPPPPPSPDTILEADTNQGSLFKGDPAVLSDQDIARILATKITLDDHHRLAILSLSSRGWWSQDLAEMEAKQSDDLIAAFKSTPHLTEVRFLPALLIPEKRTVPYLREAAARVQADLLFIYNTRIETFRRDRFLKPDEVHAQCVAESVLLDVRTGIVVHTGRATEKITAQKTAADLNSSEMLARVESEARARAVQQLAKSVVDHFFR